MGVGWVVVMVNIETSLSDLSDDIRLFNILIIIVPEGKAENH